MRRRFARKIILLIAVTSVFIVLFSPTDRLNISIDGEILFSYPLSSGQTIQTGYIHSVQLTPVEDDYRVIDSRLWLWEERVISHNAGLPFDAPRNGSFTCDNEWMYIRGGRYNWPMINLRVGNSDLGLNWMILEPFSKVELYRSFPNQLLQLQIDRQSLIISLFDKGYFSSYDTLRKEL